VGIQHWGVRYWIEAAIRRWIRSGRSQTNQPSLTVLDAYLVYLITFWITLAMFQIVFSKWEWKYSQSKWKSAQTLRAGCIKAEPKIFATPQTLFSGARDGQNLISWRWSLPTNRVWWGSMHAISSYRGNSPTHTQTHTHTHPHTHPQTGPITIHCDASSAQCNKSDVICLCR